VAQHFDELIQKLDNTFLMESAWEVCNQVGGIYTVIRSKVPVMTRQWGENFCLLGPLLNPNISAEFDPIEDLNDPLGMAVKRMREAGYNVTYGIWLVTGRPRTVLLDLDDTMTRVNQKRADYKAAFGLDLNPDEDLQNQVIAFAELSTIFAGLLAEELEKTGTRFIAHYHEWMAAIPVMEIRKAKLNIKTVFTTHATALGR
jgi:glycogen(starch) synthase